ncbi:hypothetical protein J7M07_03550 [bacterium]|nr:hypothetical protein [bacterium]
MRKAGLITLLLFSSVLGYSCIFTDDPLVPNQKPQIVSYRPEWMMATLIIPSDSVTLRIEAVDGENDPIRYSFVITNSAGDIDSVLSDSDSAVFHAYVSGIYNVQGRAYDSHSFSKHDWFIRVRERLNDPPDIINWVPGSKVVQFVVGTLVDFSLKVEDDHPENLVYGYKIGGWTIKPLSKNPCLSYRFLENGCYNLEGVVWDGEYGDTIGWNITVSGDPDTIAPDGIFDLTGRPGSEIGSVHLDWTTPGDDGSDGYAAGYLVRTSTVRIISESNWNDANSHSPVPVPLAAGIRDSMMLGSLHPGEMVYVSLRAYDEFGNLSRLSSSPHLRIRGFDIYGKVIDAGSGEGLEGAVVLSNGVVDTSLAGGLYKLENLTLQSMSLAFRSEFNSLFHGDYYDYSYYFGVLSENLTVDLCMVPVFSLIDARDGRYSDFLDFFKQMTKTTGIYEGTVYRGWNHWPITVFNPPVVCDGVDLQAAAEEAMLEWESVTGFDLFRTIENVAEADVEIFYDSTTVQDDFHTVAHHVATAMFNEDQTPKRKILFISTLISTPPITGHTHVIYTHEFGHIIGLDHSLDEGHIMIGGIFPKVDHVSTDESNLVRIIYNLPAIFDSEGITRN